MDRKQVLKNYANNIKRLKKECSDAGISEDEFKKLYFQSLTNLDRSGVTVSVTPSLIRKLWIPIVVFTLLLGLFCYKYIFSNVISNLQDYIYPGLRLIRQISIPFISLFPGLSELYQETCLIQNPFFTIVDMDCWPCSTVSNIGQVHDPQPVYQQHTAPFVYETEQLGIGIENIRDLYLRNRELFDKESSILMNNKYSTSPNNLFGYQSQFEDSNLYIWKFNNINVARILRQIIPRAKIIPKFGQSIERFIIIDSSHKLFNIPDTECHFSFLLCLSGSRTIYLNPAEECKHQCKAIKVELKESHLLWYNWWYWRPVVQQSSGNTTFIAHVGSYC